MGEDTKRVHKILNQLYAIKGICPSSEEQVIWHGVYRITRDLREVIKMIESAEVSKFVAEQKIIKGIASADPVPQEILNVVEMMTRVG